MSCKSHKQILYVQLKNERRFKCAVTDHKPTCSERGDDRVTGDVSAPGDERHGVLGVWLQAVNAVLSLRDGNPHYGFL